MIDLSVGVSGSGKTHGMRVQVAEHISRPCEGVLVPDYEYDWTELPKTHRERDLSKHVVRVYTVEQAIQAIEVHKKRLAVIRPKHRVDHGEKIMQVEHVARWVMAKPGRGIALCEAHRIMEKNKPLYGELDRLITAWRHAGIGDTRGHAHVWLDTQRLALINSTVTEQATILRLYAISGDTDMARVRAIGGRDLEVAVRDCARRLVAGEAGWHVPLKHHRLPPYEPDRMGT